MGFRELLLADGDRLRRHQSAMEENKERKLYEWFCHPSNPLHGWGDSNMTILLFAENFVTL
jgi:hypothetical protein